MGPRGGIGRRDGFKIRCLHGRASSSLAEGTIKFCRAVGKLDVISDVYLSQNFSPKIFMFLLCWQKNSANLDPMNGEEKMKPGFLDALRAVKKLLADNEDTAQVFTILEALGKRATKRAWQRFARLPQAEAILAQPDLIHLLQDRDKLAAMPEGSLGRTYYEFMAHENITADGLVEASEDGLSGKREFTPLEEKFHLRQRDSHDLWHVVTGYGRDQLGELALLAVYYRQISNPGFMMIVLFGARAGRKEYPDIGIWTAIREGLRHGKQMDWLPGIAWEDYMDMPLEEVRTKLKIAPPEKYHQARALMREMDSDYQAQAAE